MKKRSKAFISSLLVMILLSSFVAAVMCSIALDHNPQQEFIENGQILYFNLAPIFFSWFLVFLLFSLVLLALIKLMLFAHERTARKL